MDENISPSNSFESTLNTSGENDLPKKKKYKLVANSFISPTSSIEPMSNIALMSSSGSSSISTSTKVKTEKMVETTTVKTEINELPKDRKDLLKFVSREKKCLFQIGLF